MKSQYYREVSHESKIKKSSTNHKQKRLNSAQINPLLVSKGMKSQKRSLIHSIDLIKKSRGDTDQRAMKISFSRPLIEAQNLVNQIPILQQSIISVCLKCQQMQIDHQKQIKLTKMKHEQELTQQTQRYIQMQKKYLLKQNQCIKLSSQYHELLMINKELNNHLNRCQCKIHELQNKCESLQQQMARYQRQIKRYEERSRLFNHFLTLFVEQTKCMLNWAHLFQQTYQELPELIRSIKEDLSVKKLDLEIMLKQSIIFKKDNFGVQSIKPFSNQSSFLGSEEDGTQSFMKYLKQDSAATKIKTRLPSFSEIKRTDYSNQSFLTNKENIDITNRQDFKYLVHSRLNSQLEKQKSQHLKDQYLRMLLVQAKTIQQNSQIFAQKMERINVSEVIQNSFDSNNHRRSIKLQ